MHRHATLADLDAVYAIYMHDDVIPFLGYDPMSRADFAKVFAELLAGSSFYVVEEADRVQGFYRAARHEGRARHVAYLGTFAVAPEVRGSGFARSIIETAISRLHSQGVTRIELMLEADNLRALAFYKKLGFEVEGTMRSAYKRSHEAHYVDEIVMSRLLPSRSEA